MNKYKAAVLAKFPKAKVFDLNGGHMLQAAPPEFPNVYTFLHSEDVLWESAARAWGCIPEEKQAAPAIDYEAEVRKQYGPYVLIKTTHVKTSTEDKRVLSAHVPDSSLYSALGEGSTVAEAWRNAYERITTPKTPGANDKLQVDAKLVREYYIAPGTRGSIDCRASADGKRIELHFTNRYGTAVIGEGATEVEAWSNTAERLTSIRKAADKTQPIDYTRVEWSTRSSKAIADILHESVNAAMGKVSRPPLGLKPRSVHDEERIDEIRKAIVRYTSERKEVPMAWADELLELLKRNNAKL